MAVAAVGGAIAGYAAAFVQNLIAARGRRARANAVAARGALTAAVAVVLLLVTRHFIFVANSTFLLGPFSGRRESLGAAWSGCQAHPRGDGRSPCSAHDVNPLLVALPTRRVAAQASRDSCSNHGSGPTRKRLRVG